jgi:hypothetical protein
MTRLLRISLAAAVLVVTGRHGAIAQVNRPTPSPSHVVIPFLADSSKPAALGFEGGECDLDATGNAMACTFQQVFLTTSGIAPDTCLITTNRYQRAFRRDAPSGWVSRDAPEGVCGMVEVVTLRDEGGVRWTMETRKTATTKDASPACRAPDEPAEILSWQNLRRALPCKFIQPGAISP